MGQGQEEDLTTIMRNHSEVVLEEIINKIKKESEAKEQRQGYLEDQLDSICELNKEILSQLGILSLRYYELKGKVEEWTEKWGYLMEIVEGSRMFVNSEGNIVD